MTAALRKVSNDESAIRDTSGQDIPVTRDRRQTLFWVMALLVLVLMFAGLLPMAKRWVAGDIAVARERVRIAPVVEGEFIRDIAVQGVVVAAVSPTVFSPSAGTVTLLVQAGDNVAKGDSLARIDNPELSNRLAQEEATLERMETELQRHRIENRKQALANEQEAELARLTWEAAARELRRAQRSWEDRLISEQDLEKARDDHERTRVEAEFTRRSAELSNESLAFELQAQAQERDRQRLLIAELARQNAALNLSSPVAGMIGDLAVEQKTMVAANTALLTVVDLSAFEIEVRVSESYSDDIQIGMQAFVNSNGNPFSAQVSAISPQVDEGMVRVRLRLNELAPEGLRQNQRLSGKIVLEKKAQALTVARGGFLQSEGGRFVYRVERDRALRSPIVVGSSSVDKVEILQGLAAGDHIIISNTDSFEQADTVLLSD